MWGGWDLVQTSRILGWQARRLGQLHPAVSYLTALCRLVKGHCQSASTVPIQSGHIFPKCPSFPAALSPPTFPQSTSGLKGSPCPQGPPGPGWLSILMVSTKCHPLSGGIISFKLPVTPQGSMSSFS